MNTCERCGKAVGSGEWDIHTCTPKPGWCDDCETVSHCLKHGCIPKHQALEQMAQNARELGLDYEPPQRQWVGLTQEELDAMFSKIFKGKKMVAFIARAIEAKLKEKNK